MMTHSSCHVVGRTSLAPLVDELTARKRELGAHVGIAKGEDRTIFVHALGNDKLEDAVLVLRDSEIGDRTRRRIELRKISTTRLSVEHGYYLHRWLLGLRDVEVARTRVTNNADILRKIDAVHLSQCTCTRNGLQDRHCHSHLHVAFHSTGSMLLDEHRECWNQHGVELAGNALGKACIVRGYHTQFFVLHPLLEGNHILRHVPYLIDGTTTLDVEGVKNILSLGLDGCLVSDVIGNSPHLLPIELLGIDKHTVVEVSLINIEVHHAWIRASNLCDVGITETTTHLSSTAPVFNLSLYTRVTTLDNACNDSRTLASTIQISHHFTNGSASIELAQPGRDVSLRIVGSQFLLYIHNDYWHVEVTNGR